MIERKMKYHELTLDKYELDGMPWHDVKEKIAAIHVPANATLNIAYDSGTWEISWRAMETEAEAIARIGAETDRKAQIESKEFQEYQRLHKKFSKII